MIAPFWPGSCATNLRFAAPFGSWLQGLGVNLQRATAMKPWKTSSATNETRDACPSFRLSDETRDRGCPGRPAMSGSGRVGGPEGSAGAKWWEEGRGSASAAEKEEDRARRLAGPRREVG